MGAMHLLKQFVFMKRKLIMELKNLAGAWEA